VRRMLRAAASLGIAAVGGGVSLFGAGVTGHLGTRTIVQEMVTTPAVPVSRTPTRELTIEQIYRRDAPGVVQITATSVQTQQTLRTASRSVTRSRPTPRSTTVTRAGR